MRWTMICLRMTGSPLGKCQSLKSLCAQQCVDLDGVRTIEMEREERMRDEWLVLDLCGNGHCDPDGVVRCSIWDFHFR